MRHEIEGEGRGRVTARHDRKGPDVADLLHDARREHAAHHEADEDAEPVKATCVIAEALERRAQGQQRQLQAVTGEQKSLESSRAATGTRGRASVFRVFSCVGGEVKARGLYAFADAVHAVFSGPAKGRFDRYFKGQSILSARR